MSVIFAFNTPLTGITPNNMTSYTQITESEIVNKLLQAIKAGISIVRLVARKLFRAVTYCKRTLYSNYIRGIRKYESLLVFCFLKSGRILKGPYIFFQKNIQINYMTFKSINYVFKTI